MPWRSGDLLTSTNLNQKSLGSWLNVRDYGAKGDGTDDTASFFSATSAAGRTAVRQTVFVPSGSYSVSSIVLYNGARLIGAGVGGYSSLDAGGQYGSEIRQRAGSNTDLITFVGNIASNTTWVSPIEIAYLNLSGDTSATTGNGISFSSAGGVATPAEQVRLHNLFVRGFAQDGIHIPDGGIPLHVQDVSTFYNRRYGIFYSGETGIGDTQAVHFDNISADANLGGAGIYCGNVDTQYGSLLFTNIKSEMARNPDSGTTGQDNAIVLENCGGPVAIHGLTHISSCTISATSHLAPGPAIRVTGSACPSVFFSGVAVRQRPNDDIGTTWTLLDDNSNRSSGISIDCHTGFYGQQQVVPFSASSQGLITLQLGDSDIRDTVGSPDLQLKGVTPAVSFFESDSTTANQGWLIGASGGNLAFRTLNDNGTTGEIFASLTRSGTSLTDWQFSTGTVNMKAVNLSVKTGGASLSSTNVGVDGLAFFVGGASGASIGIRSGGTVYIFNSSLSTKG